MVTVRIDTQEGGSWLYGHDRMWKEYCGVDNFDETFVIHGNRNYNVIEEAEWYDKVKSLMYDFDQTWGDDDDMAELKKAYASEYSDEQWKAIVDIYDKCQVSDSDDTYLKVLRVIYPNDKWETGTIRGYSQREWNDVLYKANEVENLNLLEEYYYGHIAELYTDDDENGCSASALVTHDELWKAEREGKLEELIRGALDISKDEEIQVFESDGYIQQTKWKEVSC